MSELERLLADGVIDEVLGRLKSGKEANISLVRRGEMILAAKVYKDRATRSFKNNADYKEGRKVRNSRTQRAIDSGGKFGRDSAEQAWKSAEADALYKLVGSGVRVPAPVMFYEGVLLMELVTGADGHAAPRMIDVAIDPEAALGIYADLVAQMISMLCCDLIHGDLSPYNILAGVEGPTIIDFPQVVSAVHSSRAEFFFLRDFDNVVRFVAGFDPTLAIHRADGRAIWRAYVSRELTPQFVPPPPPPPQRREERRFDSRPPRNQRGPDPRPDQRAPQRFDQQRDQRPPIRSDQRGPQGQPPRSDGNPPQRDQRPPLRSDQGANGQPPPQRTDGRPPLRSDQRGPGPQRDQRVPQRDQRGPQRDRRGPGPQRDQRSDQRPPQDRQRPPQRTDQGPPRRTEQRSPQSQRTDQGPPRRPDPRPPQDQRPPQAQQPPQRFDPRPPQRTAPRFDPRPPQRTAPRFDPRPPPPSGGHRRRPKRHW